MLRSVGSVLAIVFLCGLPFLLATEWRARRTRLKRGEPAANSSLVHLMVLAAVILVELILAIVD